MESNEGLNYLLSFLDEMYSFNDLEFFSKKKNHLLETNSKILDFIEELYNYIPSHMREKFHRLAIITMYILGAGDDHNEKADYVKVSDESIDKVRKSPQRLDSDKIRELNPHFADLLELAEKTVKTFTEAHNKRQPSELHKIDPDDMWDLVEKAAKAYWIEIEKSKQISEED